MPDGTRKVGAWPLQKESAVLTQLPPPTPVEYLALLLADQQQLAREAATLQGEIDCLQDEISATIAAAFVWLTVHGR
jgi:hypothetical protein